MLIVMSFDAVLAIVQANAKRNFDETFEVHVKMTPDLRRTDLKLSGFVRLPHGFGKTYRVAVFAEGAAAEEARDAGADIVGGPELVENIRTGDEPLSLLCYIDRVNYRTCVQHAYSKHQLQNNLCNSFAIKPFCVVLYSTQLFWP
ncbi:UNVERIFIED_CONTAM: 50S ribosomal protein L1 [Sesamum radiatum]|uniref:50S ribosomal protein L1 n=1 Tax=Sesamum radiatum TaxID=300843 RepID=A0AAW2LMV4_SESRA